MVNQGYAVSVVNPAKIKAYYARSELSRTKIDKADAKLIARYAITMQPPLDATTLDYPHPASPHRRSSYP